MRVSLRVGVLRLAKTINNGAHLRYNSFRLPWLSFRMGEKLSGGPWDILYELIDPLVECTSEISGGGKGWIIVGVCVHPSLRNPGCLKRSRVALRDL